MKAIILAAGFSSRMGQLKQVVDFGGKPMIRHVAEPLLEAGLDLVVVIGHQAVEIKLALHDLPCEYIINIDPKEGMFSSVKFGCSAVPSGEGCLITPCDCPGVSSATIRKITQKLEHESAKVVIPTFHGRRGHPVGIPATLVERIRTLPPDTPGLRSLWQEIPEIVVHLSVPDPAILRDFDTPSDLQSGKF